jgi:ribonucleotide reductase alpha subunit
MLSKMEQKFLEKVQVSNEIIDSTLDSIIKTHKINTSKIKIPETKKEILDRIPESMLYHEFLGFMADFIVSKSSFHPEYTKLASIINVYKLHHITPCSILDVVKILYNNIDSNDVHTPIISKEYYTLVEENADRINNIIDYSRDFDFDYFGLKTLERSYLLKVHRNNKTLIIERPQHLFMRVALGLHKNNWERVHETYTNLSQRYFTHATPTLFNIGTNRANLASCFLLGVDDSLDNILSKIKEMGMISKWSGGIGIHLSSIRAKNSIIRGTNGLSDGIIPLCNVLNKLARYINQGGKRAGAIAIYLEPHHADIFEFAELRKQNSGNEDNRTRDLFLALWVSDLFMKRVEGDGMWSLMCPNECPNLNNVYGKEFEELYTKYENEKRYKKQIKARELWQHIMECQIETGMPYLLYKDHVNNKSNQKNVGTIKSSNLCVHGDTMIFTKQGYFKIQLLENKEVEIWNGEEWSNVIIRKTGTNKNLIRVNLSNGSYLDCTPEHKFYSHEKVEIRAASLKSGQRLLDLKLPQAFDLKSSTIKERIDLLQSYCSKGGFWEKDMGLRIGSVLGSDHIIEDIKYQLHTLGVDSMIIPIDEESNMLFIPLTELDKLVSLGFCLEKVNFDLPLGAKAKQHIKEIKEGIPKCYNKQFSQILVTRVEESYKNVDTYCFTEPKRGMGVFNGILTGQCAEIVQYSDTHETATCNLASLCLPRYVEFRLGIPTFNYKKLQEVTRIIVRNLNIVIDINYYPSENAKLSNFAHRACGIGVTGLAEVYNLFECDFESEKAFLLNKKIFETIYFAALDESKELAKIDGPYSTFKGSPFSQGTLQYHMWGLTEKDLVTENVYNWEKLIDEIKTFGIRNSLLTALMPTASTAQIMKCSECIEPYMSNIFVRTTFAGEFIVVNEHLVRILERYDLWNEDMRKLIILANGSIQDIKQIPDHIKAIFKTAFEIKLKSIIGQSADRGPFIDQSQSLNLFMGDSDFKRLTSAHFYGWKRGVKTSSYYLRTKPSSEALSFGIDINDAKRLKNNEKETQEPIKDCVMCSA